MQCVSARVQHVWFGSVVSCLAFVSSACAIHSHLPLGTAKSSAPQTLPFLLFIRETNLRAGDSFSRHVIDGLFPCQRFMCRGNKWWQVFGPHLTQIDLRSIGKFFFCGIYVDLKQTLRQCNEIYIINKYLTTCKLL